MKFCQDHHDKLKKAIDDRGLTRFIAKDGKTAFDLTVRQLQRTDESKGDPLLNAYWAIVNNALSVIGLDLMAQNADGSDKCPICVLKTCGCSDPGCAERFEKWIEHAADDQREHFADQIPQA